MAFSHQLRYLSAERLPAYSTSDASLIEKIHAAINSFNLKTLPRVGGPCRGWWLLGLKAGGAAA
ncbi:hypothetical protein [Cerasicoccus maritimus]|uniref:hypothetical protein n=1 Tax=Cerasicoccus maritimus TaxID=490089 RepID=UPI002852D177|nr:hypothetical protein [Cerasicoccus maritimus]